MENSRNLILAFVISLVILLGFDHFYMKPKLVAEQARQAALKQSAVTQASQQASTDSDVPQPLGTPGATAIPDGMGGQGAALLNREQILATRPKVAIVSPRLNGSIALEGGRIDDLTLEDYHDTTDVRSPKVILASPAGTDKAYYAEFGWAPAPGSNVAVPDAKTVWAADRQTLSPDQPVTLSWDNGQGLIFKRVYQLDANYMFSVSQEVQNNSDKPIALAPYSLVFKGYKPATKAFFILHEGPIGVFGEKLVSPSYSDLEKEGLLKEGGKGGWVGITDKYWLMALVPDQAANIQGRFTSRLRNDGYRYQVDLMENARTIAPGGKIDVTSRLFAGAKETTLIDSYEKNLGISRFDLAVDWGWFYWITKPIFYSLHYFHHLLGNFGLAIMLLTVLLKLAFFPLANKSYVAMSKMKLLQPKMQAIKARSGDDKVKMQQEMMALYRDEKVNPMAGCLPILLQIPVFFALYKVIFVTIEMRHAPFYGWIHDLSAQDILTPVNLFGLIPWAPPSFMTIGIWPILMGVTMYLQQKLNPAPTDPIQAKVMSFLPIIFTIMLAPFPAGLVIYWTWNNLLSIAQQWLIMKRMGVKAG